MKTAKRAKRKSSLHEEILRRVVTDKPTIGGPQSYVSKFPDAVAAIEDVMALRRKGQQTVRLTQLTKILNENIPGFSARLTQVRDYIHTRFGGWNEPGG